MLHTSNLVLNALLAHRKPALFRHMQHQLAIPASLYATPWLMSGYISRCSNRIVRRGTGALPLPLKRLVLCCCCCCCCAQLPAAVYVCGADGHPVL